MSVSQQSVLGSSQNLIASHVAGCNPPTLKNSIVLPTTITTAAPYFANVSGALYTIPIVAAAATIVLPHVAVAKGYQLDFVFSGNQTAVTTFAPLTAAGGVGAATTTPVITGHALQTNAAGTGLVDINFAVNQSLFVAGTTVFCRAGDTISFVCDGINWFVKAVSFLNNDTAVFAFTA
jgi:hypothetical protein